MGATDAAPAACLFRSTSFISWLSGTLPMALTLVASLLAAGSLVGSKAPSVTLDFGFPPTKIDLSERVAGKKVILVGLPGAFTPT